MSRKNNAVDKMSVNGYYQEKYRPQIHFSPPENWMNDPNGLVYLDGEYHLFYQHNPDTTIWGPMHWGHAISTDLLHWKHLPIALYPDSLGYIFSGSAVVDWNNTSGFGSTENPPLIVAYTYHDMDGENQGKIKNQSQAIAYSLDKGRTWIKYKNNPVVVNPGIKDFRDPKVFWHDKSDKWIMVFAANDRVKIYSSDNLKQWTFESDFGMEIGCHESVWECPDLFPLKVLGKDECKWVLTVSIVKGGPNGGSATQYFVGDFDGDSFIAQDSNTRWMDYGKDNYAGVTWSDIPQEDGRRIFIGWMTCIGYHNLTPTRKWRGNLTFPRELKLNSGQNGYFLTSKPIDEIDKLTRKIEVIKGGQFSGSMVISKKSKAPLKLELDFDSIEASNVAVELTNGLGERLEVGYDNIEKRFFIDRTNAGESDFHPDFAGVHYAPFDIKDELLDIKMLIDVSSVELFAQDGKVVMTEYFFPHEPFNKINLINKGGNVRLKGGQLYFLNSIWQ
ncbi:glycoside hydrolase family 32 protein [Saccharicrinis sp. 156]|uniref:glycoside hydrolase family 32 protein n=1 Tax=Saccharicrinis sp. 156 TaxID=3417574 RepID=UPI003D334F47